MSSYVVYHSIEGRLQEFHNDLVGAIMWVAATYAKKMDANGVEFLLLVDEDNDLNQPVAKFFLGGP